MITQRCKDRVIDFVMNNSRELLNVDGGAISEMNGVVEDESMSDEEKVDTLVAKFENGDIMTRDMFFPVLAIANVSLRDLCVAWVERENR